MLEAHSNCLRTWPLTCAQNIRLYLEVNDKESLILLTAITAARTLFPLSLIAAGKTDAVEPSPFDDVGYHWTDHSEFRWATADTFRRWLTWLDVRQLCQIGMNNRQYQLYERI
jgi:hypothetical protein